MVEGSMIFLVMFLVFVGVATLAILDYFVQEHKLNKIMVESNRIRTRMINELRNYKK